MLSRLKRFAYKISTVSLRTYYRKVWGMDIGEGVHISSSTKMDLTNPKGVHIGDYTTFTFGSAILTHDFINGVHKDTRIGSHCLIGAGAKIMPGVTIGDHCIVGPNSVVAFDVPPNTAVMGVPARIVESGIATGKWGIRDPNFLRLEGVATQAGKAPIARADVHVTATEALLSYLPQLKREQLNKTFQELAIDSFALISLRAQIEETEGITISDEDWTSITCPLDICRWTRRGMTRTLTDSIDGPAAVNSACEAKSREMAADAAPNGLRRERADSPATARRSYEINLPHMAVGGLSEGWLFREAGDVHWSMLTSALGVRSSNIFDQTGARLYATFTRLRYQSTVPLRDIKIDSRLELSSKINRFGAGMFFSNTKIVAAGAEIDFDVATSFSRFGEHGSNTSLIKGQPTLPEGFAIPALGALPEFIDEYRRLRAAELGPTLFETEYEIIPQHDINGVGLIYFAAYPNISDICLMRYLGGAHAAMEWSPLERDVCYFANASPRESLIFRIHSERSSPDHNTAAYVCSISRKSDNKTMARVEAKLERREASTMYLPADNKEVLA
ncbi:MAG TPA: LnmK family bifunctional acyltransferase/decarboxylase [Candidatus Dormibacteraeota bacterium]|nr:LnmK family bifunctional acyltransferase/decarboxylase [Candidatus Dormibacteraeota bacterium]